MAAGELSITPDASARALDARISPSAAITFAFKYKFYNIYLVQYPSPTLALAALPASASAAMVLCSCSGSLASLLQRMETLDRIVCRIYLMYV